MAVIISLLDPQTFSTQHQWRFATETIIRIGRAPELEVTIDHKLVSRFHAEIRYPGKGEMTGFHSGRWQLINKGTNGTIVDGNLVPQAFLNSGSVFQLARGGPFFRFEIAVTSTPPACQHLGNSPDSLFCKDCGQPLGITQQVGKYQIWRPLGQGGMGTTYLAWDGQQQVVVKSMNVDIEGNEKARELFDREAKILGQLEHPGIPHYRDFFIDAGKKYLVMDLLRGQDLEKYIFARGPVPVGIVRDWLAQLGDILDYLHSRNPPIVHRDVKPANLLLRLQDSKIFLLDFGAVKEIGTIGSTRIGAPDYMAPEQNRGEPLPASDLYALGPTALFLLSGKSPVEFIDFTPEGLRFNAAKIPNLSNNWIDAIAKVTSLNPRDRFPNAAAFIAAIDKL